MTTFASLLAPRILAVKYKHFRQMWGSFIGETKKRYRNSNTDSWRSLPPKLACSARWPTVKPSSQQAPSITKNIWSALLVPQDSARIARLFRKVSLTETKPGEKRGTVSRREQNAGRTIKLQQHYNTLTEIRGYSIHEKRTSCYRKGKTYRMRKSS